MFDSVQTTSGDLAQFELESGPACQGDVHFGGGYRMKTATDVAGVRVAPLGRVAELHVVPTDDMTRQLERARAQIEALKEKLASSQEELTSSQRQLKSLTEANMGFTRPLVWREHEVACSLSQSSPRKSTDCLSAGLDSDAMECIAPFLTRRIRFAKGDQIYQVGEVFNALYVIDVGSCKTILLARDGHDQIAGYFMAGDIIGMDGISGGLHECGAIAVEAMEVYLLPFTQIETLARRSRAFQHNLHKLLSEEGVRAQALMLLLGTMHADQRLAMFLLDLSRRYQSLGYSSCEFVLRMTRLEIGSHLGIKLETVSRLFSRFQRDGLVQVQGRTVKLLDSVSLNRLVECSA